MNAARVRKLAAVHAPRAEVTGRGADWMVMCPDDETRAAFETHVCALGSGFYNQASPPTFYGRPGEGFDRGDPCDPTSPHHW